MKKILGLDLGVSSIGWALVNEASESGEVSSIEKIGVRVNPITVDEKQNFEKGKAITTCADRTLKRSMRRNNQRYKLRREHLKELLVEGGLISDDTVLAEDGKNTTFETIEYRARAASEKITLDMFARVLLNINKKRGYKSSRKVKSTEEDGALVDAMEVTKLIKESGQTPGQYCFELLKSGQKTLPTFYKSDLQDEFSRIWDFQKQFYPDQLTDVLKEALQGKNRTQTWAICKDPFNIEGIKREGNSKNRTFENYQWRSHAVTEQLGLEELAIVFQEINGKISASSGYLSDISDRSKTIFFNGQTIGQYQWEIIRNNYHAGITNLVFYRQDYIAEFEKIWNTQAAFYPTILTPELKKAVKDEIFYQRPLKSQKGKISLCELTTKEFGPRVCPKSSPIFQDFRIWQRLNDLQVTNAECSFALTLDEKNSLYKELSFKEKLSKKDILTILYGKNAKYYDLNFKELIGNKTNVSILVAIQRTLEEYGQDDINFAKRRSDDIEDILTVFKSDIGIPFSFFTTDYTKAGQEFDKQPIMELWHLLYSYQGDNSKTGNDSLIEKLKIKFGFSHLAATFLASATFEEDYSNLSSRAMKKILPFMMEGKGYAEACEEAGFNHSKHSLTSEQLDSKPLLDRMEEIKKDSLRNPVVEKILNQMVNVVNAVIEEYGQLDEVRIEMARSLKNNAERRANDLKRQSESERYNDQCRQEILSQKHIFGLDYVSHNDLVRYRLYKELESNGFKTLYSNTYISPQDLFTNRFDIEHIIPQSRLFDDSYSNKTLETRDVNREKSNDTAYDYMVKTYSEDEVKEYVAKVRKLCDDKVISKAKRDNLLRTANEIPEEFLNRDLVASQYIARKAKEMLETIVRRVVPTTGSITDQLREDWGLINIMREITWDKYSAAGLTYYETNKDGQKIPKIKEWSKRIDHRHHAMDALTIAFTKESIIQYLNNLNARSDRSSVIYAIEQKELERDSHNHLRFREPVPNFRAEARRQLEDVLVSIKSKNKVTTKNTNVTKTKDGDKRKVQETPRHQLHNETVYGERHLIVKDKKGNPKVETIYTIRKAVDKDLKIDKVMDPVIQRILRKRLERFGGDAPKAFTNLDKDPIWLNEAAGIAIKTVRIKGPTEVVPLHTKNNHRGQKVVVNGENVPTDFVQTSGNHHIAIYEDENGKWHEMVVSYFEATDRKNNHLPIIDKDYNKDYGWKFLFSMKQNEYFIFPDAQTGFDPSEIDLLDPENLPEISKHLFRVQKLSTKNYMFRHHLETSVEDTKELRDVTWINIRAISNLKGIIKVRLNHLGKIVHIGE